MTQCRGTTKQGERCRREATGSSDYCSIHMDQAGQESTEHEEWDVDAILKTALGFALIGAVVLFRIRR